MPRSLAALVVPAFLALLPAGCGDDDESSSGPVAKGGVEGTGYSFTAPDGYRDVTGKLDGSAVRIDRAYADPEATGFATNVVVIRETPEGDLDLDDVTAQFVDQVEDTLATDAGVGAVEDRELDGVPAKTYAFRSRQDENGPLRQRQVVAVEDDAIYTITWSVAADAFEEQEATLDRVLESWRWD